MIMSASKARALELGEMRLSIARIHKNKYYMIHAVLGVSLHSYLKCGLAESMCESRTNGTSVNYAGVESRGWDSDTCLF